MKYFVNIGNQHSEWTDENFEKYHKTTTKKFFQDIKKSFTSHDKLIISSVFLPSENLLKKSLLNYSLLDYSYCEKIINLEKVAKEQLGIDRLTNLVAALIFYQAPILVIDCGTCITIEVLNEKKEFCGGFILPNKYIQSQAMKKQIPQLPIITKNTIPKSFQLGKNTKESIELSLYYSIIAFIEKAINFIDKQYTPIRILITGGDKETYYKELKKKFKCELCSQSFNLQGIKKIWELNNEK